MQLYKVKLFEGHSAEANQIVNGYLGDATDVFLYTRGEAIKKAKMFGGKIEKHGKNYTVNETAIIDLCGKELSSRLIMELEDREVYTDADDDINEPIYYGDIFAAILGEESEKQNQSARFIEELIILDNICSMYDYVRIM